MLQEHVVSQLETLLGSGLTAVQLTRLEDAVTISGRGADHNPKDFRCLALIGDKILSAELITILWERSPDISVAILASRVAMMATNKNLAAFFNRLEINNLIQFTRDSKHRVKRKQEVSTNKLPTNHTKGDVIEAICGAMKLEGEHLRLRMFIERLVDFSLIELNSSFKDSKKGERRKGGEKKGVSKKGERRKDEKKKGSRKTGKRK